MTDWNETPANGQWQHGEQVLDRAPRREGVAFYGGRARADGAGDDVRQDTTTIDVDDVRDETENEQPDDHRQVAIRRALENAGTSWPESFLDAAVELVTRYGRDEQDGSSRSSAFIEFAGWNDHREQFEIDIVVSNSSSGLTDVCNRVAATGLRFDHVHSHAVTAYYTGNDE